MIISVFDRVENIVGKGEIACTSNFSLSHNVFNKLFSMTHQKVSLCGNGLTLKVPSPTFVAFVASVDQDQAAQNALPDLKIYTEIHKTKATINLQLLGLHFYDGNFP